MDKHIERSCLDVAGKSWIAKLCLMKFTLVQSHQKGIMEEKPGVVIKSYLSIITGARSTPME